RAEHIGSLLRPPELMRQRARFAKGEIDQAALTVAEDKAIVEAIRLQERLGFKFVTDGEFRRRSYHSFFYGAWANCASIRSAALTRWVQAVPAGAVHNRRRLSVAGCSGPIRSMGPTQVS